MSRPTPVRLLALLLSSALAAACGSDNTSEPVDPGADAGTDTGGDTGGDAGGDTTERPIGATDFVSADGLAGQTSETDDGTETAAPGDRDAEGGGDRSVEEGDIYRVLDGGLLLNLNSWRGLQVVDVSSPEEPEIIGRLRVSGTPVEMYVVGDRAFVLLNNWRGYYGVRGDVAVDTRTGGLVLAVDLSDPSNPVELDRAYIPGWVMTSRLTRGSEGVALYVTNTAYDEYPTADGGTTWESRAIVQSFDVSDGQLDPVQRVDLGGYVADIQATPEFLLVARNYWNRSESHSRVALIDISDPRGEMREVGEVAARGYVRNQFNMDVHDGVLRVVSDGNWSGRNTNHLQTFDAETLAPIDHCTFGDGQSLFATLFLSDRAFFVTYLRVDPFHAFALSADGHCEERAEFIVSGWNDFFRPVFDESRLIGIGINDEGGRRTLAVSLYDITDLDNPSPLIDRASVEADNSWSEANWDHRAFSVLQGAVDVRAADGTPETGMVLLPFQGYDADYRGYRSAVQIFTFSETTLTRRGLMDHGTPVRRSFRTAEDVVGNLSEIALSLFDVTNPDAPAELGTVELAPNFSEILGFGDFRARVRGPEVWWYDVSELPPAVVEVVRDSADPDLGQVVASFEIPGASTAYKVGDLLVAVEMRVVDTSSWPYDYDSTIEVWDLSDPTAPRRTSRLEDDRLRPSWGYYGGWWGEMDCFDCRGGGYWWMPQPSNDVQVIDDGLAFLTRNQEQELEGTEEVCNTYPVRYDDCRPGEDESTCTYVTGGISCRSLEGAEPVCSGSFQRCRTVDGEWTCEPIEADEIETGTNCYEYERYRYWQSLDLITLDVSDPGDAALSETFDLPLEHEGVGIVADRSDIWVSYKVPFDVPGDSRPYVRYFAQRYDASDPAAPVADVAINVPGELVAVDADTLYTRDFIWGDRVVETAIARLRVFEGLAYLQAVRRFEDQQVETVTLDGGGHVLISHRIAWQVFYEERRSDENPTMLTILDGSDDLDVLSAVRVDSWATLRDAVAGRALFEVPGGLLVINTDDGSAPFATAYFATLGWPLAVHIDDRDIIFAAGRYGIYRFDLDEYNLLPPL